MTVTTTGFTEEALEEVARRDGDGGLVRRRREAFRWFQTMPMPSPETEEWRYTDIRDLDLSAFVPLAPAPPAATLDQVDPGLLEAMGPVGDRSGLAIQHNSTVVTAHLDPDLAARGVVLASLDEALRSYPDLLGDGIHRTVPPERTRFTALHAAFRTGGTFVYVPPGVRVGLPLQTVVYVDREGLAVFPHTVIVAGEGSEVTFIDRYLSPDLERALSDAVVEVHAGPASRVSYVALQEWGRGMTHLSVQRATVGRDADFRSLGVAFGATLARSEVESILAEEGGSSEMLGVYFADGDQHFDHRSIQDHVGSRTSSDLLYKGALKGRSRAIYSGTVIIEAGAHRCDAYQTNRNILLSDTARAHSVPNLEILTNDPVRCGHAASVGPVDEDELFYIQSRGIPYEQARRLIVLGFFQEVLDRVAIEEVRASLEGAIRRELEGEEG